MPIQILHAADFHLDAPFASLNAEQAAERRGEQRELLARLAELARSRGADLVLLSGDLLDSGETYHETVQALSSALGRMEAQVFIAPGNHDFYSPRSIYAGTRWPENVHIFSTVQVESVELPALGCVVHGCAFTGGERRGELVRLTYDDTFLGGGYKQITLRERGESWQFVSNLAVQTEERVSLESGLAALPAELADKVVVVEKNDLKSYSSGILATYYYAPDYNTEWGGLLLQVGRYSQVGFEQSYYSWELTGGWAYLGRSGDWYYACHSPTDVNFNPDHYGDYQATGAALMAWLEELAAGAGLTPMEEDSFYQRVNGVLSYPHGEHLRVSYRPYYGLSGYEEVADTVYTLVLSQPATQGERGIWCVDRWMDQNGTRYLVVPETDQPMDDYYAALQDACDAGERPDLLDPVAVALDFEEDWSGRDLSPDAFVLEGASDLSELFDLPLATVELENGVGG